MKDVARYPSRPGSHSLFRPTAHRHGLDSAARIDSRVGDRSVHRTEIFVDGCCPVRQAPDRAGCLMNRFLWGGRPLDQLDAGAPRISDICERDASRLVLADWLIKLDALRFDLLDEGL